MNTIYVGDTHFQSVHNISHSAQMKLRTLVSCRQVDGAAEHPPHPVRAEPTGPPAVHHREEGLHAEPRGAGAGGDAGQAALLPQREDRHQHHGEEPQQQDRQEDQGGRATVRRHLPVLRRPVPQHRGQRRDAVSIYRPILFIITVAFALVVTILTVIKDMNYHLGSIRQPSKYDRNLCLVITAVVQLSSLTLIPYRSSFLLINFSSFSPPRTLQLVLFCSSLPP